MENVLKNAHVAIISCVRCEIYGFVCSSALTLTEAKKRHTLSSLCVFYGCTQEMVYLIRQQPAKNSDVAEREICRAGLIQLFRTAIFWCVHLLLFDAGYDCSLSVKQSNSLFCTRFHLNFFGPFHLMRLKTVSDLECMHAQQRTHKRKKCWKMNHQLLFVINLF